MTKGRAPKGRPISSANGQESHGATGRSTTVAQLMLVIRAPKDGSSLGNRDQRVESDAMLPESNSEDLFIVVEPAAVEADNSLLRRKLGFACILPHPVRCMMPYRYRTLADHHMRPRVTDCRVGNLMTGAERRLGALTASETTRTL